MKRLVFTVTNELNFDQRMQRICESLQSNGYDVMLIGRQYKSSPKLQQQVFKQKRLRCFFRKGFLFYGEYNIRLFFYLIFSRVDVYCAIDLDTILPVYFASIFKNKKRVYDAHEYFTEQKEIVTRPLVHRVWLTIENFSVPRFPNGYTVNQSLAHFFLDKYKVNYKIVRNFASLKYKSQKLTSDTNFILYQGAVNEGRGFENLIPAMRQISIPLHIYGKGNFLEEAKLLVKKYNVESSVIFKGAIPPDELRKISSYALFGILLMDSEGKNNYYSLANRFSDYIMAGIPQICVDYPEYHSLNEIVQCADLIPDFEEKTLVSHIQNLIDNKDYYDFLLNNTQKAQTIICWENEEKTLIDFYSNL